MMGASAGMRALPRYFMACALSAWTAFVSLNVHGESLLGRDIEQLTGAHTKLVWIHHGQQKELTVLDSQDGASRILHKGFSGYGQPWISADGESVVFADEGTEAVFAIRWDGTDLRRLTDGHLYCLWQDPQQGHTWVYFGRHDPHDSRRCLIFRQQLDEPSVIQSVTSLDLWASELALSGDGHYAAIRVRDGRRGDDRFAVVVKTKDFGKTGSIRVSMERSAAYCVTPDAWSVDRAGAFGVAPANGCRLFYKKFAEHDGSDVDQGIRVVDHWGASPRLVTINSLPGNANVPRLGDPRWSNDPRFLTIGGFTGPDGPRAAPDLGSLEVYVGRFTPDFAETEGWIRVTKNAEPDTAACAWLDPGVGRYEGEAPFRVTLPGYRLPGDGWDVDFGDGAPADVKGYSHVFTKAGTYRIQATNKNQKRFGDVIVHSPAPPVLLEADLIGDKQLDLLFDEPVQLNNPSLRLGAGAKVIDHSLHESQKRVTLMLDRRPEEKDTLVVEGLSDQAQQPNSVAGKVDLRLPAWPRGNEDLILSWEALGRQYFRQANTGRSRPFTLEARNQAHLQEDGRMRFLSGVLEAHLPYHDLHEPIVKRQAMALELVFQSSRLNQGQRSMPALLVNFGNTIGNAAFWLGQVDNQLAFFIQTAERKSLLADYNAAIAAITDAETNKPLAQAMSATDLDTREWSEMDLPGNWEAGGLKDVDGLVWFRKEVNIPDGWAGQDLVLHLGTVDEIDTTFFNGTEVGGMGSYADRTTQFWKVPRVYPIRGALVKPGRAVITVRAIDTYGKGGLRGAGAGKMRLEPQAAKGTEPESITLDGKWQYRLGTAILPDRRWWWPSPPPVEPGDILCPLPDTRPHHLIVTYRPGQLVCYLDGRKVHESKAFTGAPGNWDPGYLTFGNFEVTERSYWNFIESASWQGRISAVALYSRFVEEREAKSSFDYFSPGMKKEKDLPSAEVEVELLAASRLPGGAEIAPCTQALVAHEYRVLSIRKGELAGVKPGETIRVFHVGRIYAWGSRTTPWAEAKKGKVYRLALQRLADHPEAKGYYFMADELPQSPAIPYYYDAGGYPECVTTDR
jgi:hypothetical protein